MKKIYALMAAAALAGQAQAQVMEKVDGYNFTSASQNGRFLLQNLQGTLDIYDRTTGEEYACYDTDGVTLYMAGLGNSVSNSGRVVGMKGDEAAIWYKGEWTSLPQATGRGTTYNTGHAISADESRICGVLGNDGASMDGGTGQAMAYPVVWTKNASGEYECTKLPCPDKDFTGATPQFVTAICMSADGKTVVGQVRDFSGFYIIPILYREQQDGSWTWQLIGESQVYDKSRIGELPQRPVQPTMPLASSYMSEEDVARYNAAMAKYEEDVTKYYNGEIDTYPDYPLEQDYISDPQSKADYDADMAQYQLDQQKYMEDYTRFQTKLDEIVTNKSFIQNTLSISADGRFLAATVEDRNVNGGDTWGQLTLKTVGYFDLQQDDPQFIEATEGGDYISTTVANDGTILYASPSTEYTRTSYAVNPYINTPAMPFEKYLAMKSQKAAEWVKENNTYDVSIWGYDDDGNPIITDVVEDSVVTGTVMGNAEGTFFYSYYTDTFSADGGQSVAYYVDLADLNGIASAEATEPRRAAVRYYNLQGQQLQSAPRHGLYIESDGQKTVKRMAE